jgi:hypothetical protein
VVAPIQFGGVGCVEVDCWKFKGGGSCNASPPKSHLGVKGKVLKLILFRGSVQGLPDFLSILFWEKGSWEGAGLLGAG